MANLKKGTNTYKTSKSYSDLLKLELLCKIAPSTVIETASDKGGKMIKGGIKNVAKGEGDSVTFDVENSKDGLIKGATWSLKISGDKLTITNVQGKRVENYDINGDIALEWDAEKGCWVNKSGKKLAKYIVIVQPTDTVGEAFEVEEVIEYPEFSEYVPAWARKLKPGLEQSNPEKFYRLCQVLEKTGTKCPDMNIRNKEASDYNFITSLGLKWHRDRGIYNPAIDGE